MLRRALQIVTLIVVAALLASSQCYAMCAASACAASFPQSSHCQHHSDKKNSSGKACQHQHPEFFGPQANTDLAKFASLQFTGSVALPCAAAIPTTWAQTAVEIIKRSGPNEHLGTSVLALLSSFRI